MSKWTAWNISGDTTCNNCYVLSKRCEPCITKRTTRHMLVLKKMRINAMSSGHNFCSLCTQHCEKALQRQGLRVCLYWVQGVTHMEQ